MVFCLGVSLREPQTHLHKAKVNVYRVERALVKAGVRGARHHLLYNSGSCKTPHEPTLSVQGQHQNERAQSIRQAGFYSPASDSAF